MSPAALVFAIAVFSVMLPMGVVAVVGIIVVIGANLLGIVREGGIKEPGDGAQLSFVWLFYPIGVTRVVFGVAVLVSSRRISEPCVLNSRRRMLAFAAGWWSSSGRWRSEWV